MRHDLQADLVRAKISDRQPEIVKFAEGLKKDGYEKVSLVGYCWGKLVCPRVRSEVVS